MIPYKLNEELEFNLPTGYHELTIDQYARISDLDTPDVFAVVEILSGIKKEVLWNVKVSTRTDSMLSGLEWMSDIPKFLELPLPEEVKLGSDVIPVPREIRQLTWGQKIQFGEEFKKAFKPDGSIQLPIVAPAIAVYLTTEPYSDKKYLATLELVKQMPCTDAIPLAGFFLACLLKSWS